MAPRFHRSCHRRATAVGRWLVAAVVGSSMCSMARGDLAELAIGSSPLACTKLLARRDALLASPVGGGGGTGVRASAAAYGDKNLFDGDTILCPFGTRGAALAQGVQGVPLDPFAHAHTPDDPRGPSSQLGKAP